MLVCCGYVFGLTRADFPDGNEAEDRMGKTFELAPHRIVVCESQGTRYGFRHLASVFDNGREVGRAKACYYNRTWEAFEFQSVLHEAIDKAFDKKTAKRYKNKVDGKKRVDPQLKAVAGICALGEILCKKPEERNSFKKRILGTIPGIDFPEDFNSLPETEKQRRLDGAVNLLK